MIRVGELFELGIWHTGDLTGAADILLMAFEQAARGEGIEFGPVQTEALSLDHPRVPDPPSFPPGIAGMLVGWAEVKHIKPIVIAGSFIADLDPKDLDRLREITRRSHQRLNPGKPPLPDRACDEWIERVGPEAAVAELRTAVNEGDV